MSSLLSCIRFQMVYECSGVSPCSPLLAKKCQNVAHVLILSVALPLAEKPANWDRAMLYLPANQSNPSGPPPFQLVSRGALNPYEAVSPCRR
jgi:hypothetical protein